MDFLKNLQGYILGICSVSGGIATIYAAYVNETDELTHVFVDGEEIIATPSALASACVECSRSQIIVFCEKRMVYLYDL